MTKYSNEISVSHCFDCSSDEMWKMDVNIHKGKTTMALSLIRLFYTIEVGSSLALIIAFHIIHLNWINIYTLW